jgi:hypothetical protein
VLESFALDVIRHQPLAYARTVLGDMEHYASFSRSTGRRDEAIGEWQFHVIVPLTPRHIALVTREAHRWGGSVGGRIEAQRLLRAYQRVVFTPGTLLLIALVLAVAGAAVGAGPGMVRGVRAETLTLAAAGLLLPLTAAMTSMFDYRYLLPALPLLPAAGVLGCSALTARARALRPAAADPVQP